jgi:hypothetical protein
MGMETTATQTIGETMVDASIDQQFEEKDVQTVGEFTEGVQENVEEQVDTLRVVFGDKVDDIVGPAMQEAKSYTNSMLKIYRPDFEVQDTEAEDASAWFDLEKETISIGQSGLKRNLDKKHWGRISKHEVVHEQDQAKEFNLDSIWYPTDTLKVKPTLVEWQAITDAKQPDSDLTPEYKKHKSDGDALVKFLGSDEPLRKALKTGDMQELQELILRKVLEKDRQQDMRKAG